MRLGRGLIKRVVGKGKVPAPAEDQPPRPAPDPAPSYPMPKVVISAEQMAKARANLPEGHNWSGRPLRLLAHAAAAASRPEGYPPEYDLLQSGGFDHVHYLGQRPDVARARLDPVAHYLRAGAEEGVNPVPWFCGDRWTEAAGGDLQGMTPFGHWLTHGGGDRVAVFPVPAVADLSAGQELSEADYLSQLEDLRADVRDRLETGELGEMVAKAAALDPLVAHAWTEASAPRFQPAHDKRASARLAVFRAVHEAAGGVRADAVVLVGDARWGSSRRMEGHIAHGLEDLPGINRVALISTDRPGALPAAKVPSGGVHIDFAGLAAGLPPPDRRRVLAEVLRALRPGAAFLVNSRLGWEMLTDYGAPLTATVRMFGCMFCNDKDVFGRWGGYPATRFYRHFNQLAGVCTDSAALKADLIAQHLVPDRDAARITVLTAPVDPEIPARAVPPQRDEGRRPQVFWAGRLDPQKRLDIAYAVARALPQVDFRLWGRPVAGGMDPKADKPGNVSLEGSYARFSDLPMEEADAWLYTSEWDGVPSILLEAGMTGVPIVGVRVGGTGEVLRDGLCWGVDNCEDVGALVQGLTEALGDPAKGHARARALREALVSERTEAAYGAALARLLEGQGHG